jgi:hypothetical protein
VQTVAGIVGQVTAGARMRPSFLILGAQRCGTTSLYRALAAHPQVAPASLHKGVHYFDVAYNRGLSWYLGHFALRAGRAGRIAGEASPYYLFHPAAAHRIADDLPKVKLIVLLRDPVERAYSHHAHEVARGFEELRFEAAVDLEQERLAGEEERIAADDAAVSFSHQHHSYLARGHYADQLVRFGRRFAGDRLLVLESAEFFARPDLTYDTVVHFLGLAPWRPRRFVQHNAHARPAMAATTRTRLEAHFRPLDERLSDVIGWKPSWLRL